MDLKKQKLFCIIMLLLGSFAVKAQPVQKVGTNPMTIKPSSVLELESITKGFLPPRMTTAQRNAIVSPVAGLMIYCTDVGTRGEPEFYDGAQWMSMSTISLNVNTITTSTGKVWMDRNLGAAQVATAGGDQASYGSLFQWGRAADGHQLMTWSSGTAGSSVNAPVSGSSTTSTVTTNSTQMLVNYSNWYIGTSPARGDLWQGAGGINNPCPSGYRLPTSTEIDAERSNFSPNDANGALNYMKLPMPGQRKALDGTLGSSSSWGYYWTSTVNGSLTYKLIFNYNSASIATDDRASANSVRCIKD